MVTQTSIDPANARTKPRLGRSLNGFAHDVVALSELQLRLLAVDCRDAKAAAMRGVVMMAAGAVLAFGLVPILLAVIGFALVEFADWNYTASFGTAAGVSLLLAGLCAWLGWKSLMSSGSPFKRSKAEFQETVHWIKETLRSKPDESRYPE